MMRRFLPIIMTIITLTLLCGIAISAFAGDVTMVDEAEKADKAVAMQPIFLAFVLALSIFLGFELISKVPATLHTPLMSGSNAISGITLVGAVIVAGNTDGGMFSTILGTAAVAFAITNVVGGYMVTNRMLEMFKKKEKPADAKQLKP